MINKSRLGFCSLYSVSVNLLRFRLYKTSKSLDYENIIQNITSDSFSFPFWKI